MVFAKTIKIPVDGGDAIMITLKTSRKGVYSANGIATGKRI